MIGCFWARNSLERGLDIPYNPHTFVGNIDVDNGTFKGTVVDAYGMASVGGVLSMDCLGMKKTYTDASKGGAKGGVEYFLFLATVPFECSSGSIPSGWKGFCEALQGDGNVTRYQAACMMYPTESVP